MQSVNSNTHTEGRHMTDTLVIIRFSFPKEISPFESGFSLRQW